MVNVENRTQNELNEFSSFSLVMTSELLWGGRELACRPGYLNLGSLGPPEVALLGAGLFGCCNSSSDKASGAAACCQAPRGQ